MQMVVCHNDYGHAKHFVYKRYASCKVYSGHFSLIEKKDKFEIWSLGIKPKYQNKGNATRMLREFLAQFKADKPLVLYVYKTNEIAIRLYKNVGFVIVGQCKFDSDAYEMRYKGEV